MTPWFIATEPFTPIDGQRWDKYVEWSGLKQLEELVSLDALLCPTLLRDVKDEYWPHIVNEDYMLHFFTDLDFLMKGGALKPQTTGRAASPAASGLVRTALPENDTQRDIVMPIGMHEQTQDARH